MKTTRSQCILLSAEFPVGDPFGGPAAGRREDFISSLFGGSSPPDPNPGMFANAEAARESANASREISKDQLAWARELAQKQLDVAQPIVDQQRRIADSNEARAGEQWERYKRIFAPVEERMVADATGYDSPEQMERVRQQAAGNANTALDAADESRRISLSRMGVNPNSGRFADPNATSGVRAAAVAGSMNSATENLRDKAIGLRAGAASFGRNMPNTAAQAYGLANSSGNSAVGNINATANSVMANTGTPTQWTGLATSGYGTSGGLYNSAYQGQLSAYNTQQQSNASMFGGLGKLAGMWLGGGSPTAALAGVARGGVIKDGSVHRMHYSEGGLVRGPGTATSDSIPAALSNGEAVLNAGAVQMLGEEFVHMANAAGIQANKPIYESAPEDCDGDMDAGMETPQQEMAEMGLTRIGPPPAQAARGGLMRRAA